MMIPGVSVLQVITSLALLPLFSSLGWTITNLLALSNKIWTPKSRNNLDPVFFPFQKKLILSKQQPILT